MRKKPFILIFIGTILINISFFMFAQVLFYFHHTPGEVIEIFSKLTRLNLLIIFLSPITGYYILKVDLKGYYFLFFLSIIVVINNILVFMGPKLHDSVWIVGGTLFFICINLFLMQKKYSQLFLNPSLHWWKTAIRYDKRFKIILIKGIKRFEGETLDISKTGAFVKDNINLSVGEKFMMKIYFNNISVVKGECEIVRRGIGHKGNIGLGLEFDSFNKASKILLSNHVS